MPNRLRSSKLFSIQCTLAEGGGLMNSMTRREKGPR